MASDIPPQVQNQIAQLQELQSQHQAAIQQKQQLESRVQELTRSLEELEETDEDTPIYRSVGGLLIKVQDRADLVDELEDEKETLSVRLDSLKKQEERVKSKMEKLQSNIQQALGGGPAPQGG